MNYKPTAGPVAKEAFPFALPPAVLFIAFAILGWQFWSIFMLLLFAYVLIFFRNPDRYESKKIHDIIAPADGKLVAAGLVQHPDFEGGQALRLAVFMSVLDCHINWTPCAGTVDKAQYYPGQFVNAMDDKSSEENERKIVWMTTETGHRVVVKLVAGLIARRIICPLEEGDELKRGEKIGLIRFGSRVELLVPANSALHVRPGMMVRGGQTVLATLSNNGNS